MTFGQKRSGPFWDRYVTNCWQKFNHWIADTSQILSVRRTNLQGT